VEAGRRLSFLRACGVAARPLVLRQVHAAGVVRAAEVPEDAIPEADAAVWVRADGPARAPAVRTADCVPVLLAERSGRAAAAVHAGWRGTAAGIAAAAVRALTEQGYSPAHLIAALGPAIGGCCYEVGPEVLAALGIQASGPARVDLHARLREDLRAAGVPAAAIHAAPWCTRCRADLFFSYRREKEGAGRLMAVIGPSA
jgi:YfiH family protein